MLPLRNLVPAFIFGLLLLGQGDQKTAERLLTAAGAAMVTSFD